MFAAVENALGWAKKTYGWPEPAGTALRDEFLRLGAADPARSATGLLRAHPAERAAAGSPRDRN